MQALRKVVPTVALLLAAGGATTLPSWASPETRNASPAMATSPDIDRQPRRELATGATIEAFPLRWQACPVQGGQNPRLYIEKISVLPDPAKTGENVRFELIGTLYSEIHADDVFVDYVRVTDAAGTTFKYYEGAPVGELPIYPTGGPGPLSRYMPLAAGSVRWEWYVVVSREEPQGPFQADIKVTSRTKGLVFCGVVNFYLEIG